MENKNGCEYCITDRDGYSTYLPRTGIGRAFILSQSILGPHIDVSGPHGCRFNIPIKFCPECGRSLLKGRGSDEA